MVAVLGVFPCLAMLETCRREFSIRWEYPHSPIVFRKFSMTWFTQASQVSATLAISAQFARSVHTIWF